MKFLTQMSRLPTPNITAVIKMWLNKTLYILVAVFMEIRGLNRLSAPVLEATFSECVPSRIDFHLCSVRELCYDFFGLF